MESQIREAIAALFLGGDTNYALDPATDLLQAGICDSLGLMELALDLERRFPAVKIDDQDITPANLGSVERISRFLRSKGAS